MNHLHQHRNENIIKTWALITLFLTLVIGLGYFSSSYFQNPQILYYFVFFSVFMSVLSYWFSDKMVLMMTGAKPADKKDFPAIYELVESLAKKANLPNPKIYIVKDSAPNAFATGRNPQNAVVAVTTGLLERLNKDELEGVLAHELSHIGNRDMLVSTVVVVLVGFVSILSDFFLRSMLWSGSRDSDNRSGGAVIMFLSILGAILVPLAATLIQLAISRKREFLADASGALLTKNPKGLANALEKISQYPQSLRLANNTTAHLWFENPFRGRGVYKLFMTHPPVEERIKALLG